MYVIALLYVCDVKKNKSNLFEKQDIGIAVFAKALSHPARIKILKLLLIKSPQMSSEIVEQIPLSQATVSQHLSELKYAKLITDKKEGTKVMYSANKDVVAVAYNAISSLFTAHVKKVQQQKLF